MIEIVLIGFLGGMLFVAGYYFLKGLFKIYKQFLNKK